MKKILFIILLILLCFNIYSFSQMKSAVNTDSIKILQLEEKLQRKVDSLAHENALLKEHINLGYDNVREDSRRTLTTIQIVLAVFAGIVALIGIIVGFGAPRYVRNKVNEKVSSELDVKVKEKVTEDSIKEIIQAESKKGVEKLTKELEEKSRQIIENAENELKQKVNALEDLRSKYDKILSEIGLLKDKKIEEFTPEEKEKVKEFSETLSEFKDEDKYTANDWFWKARKEYNNMQYEKAIADYNKAIELKPDYAEAYINRGNAYNNLQKYDKAIADYNKAIELKPGDAEEYNNRGFTYNNLQKYNEAIKDWEKVIELKPEYKNKLQDLIDETKEKLKKQKLK